MKKLLLFGARKIGRSFIGQHFARSGYTLQFVDIDSRVVELLNYISYRKSLVFLANFIYTLSFFI